MADRVADDPAPYAVVAALHDDSVEKGSLAWADLRAAGADDRLITIIEFVDQLPVVAPRQMCHDS